MMSGYLTNPTRLRALYPAKKSHKTYGFWAFSYRHTCLSQWSGLNRLDSLFCALAAQPLGPQSKALQTH
jgi:hypothetical protein